MRNARMQGKSYYQHLMTEYALESGKTVLSVTPTGMYRKRRKGHLTLITRVSNP